MPKGSHANGHAAKNSENWCSRNGRKKNYKKGSPPKGQRRYAQFSQAAQRQAELNAKGGSLLKDMPILKERESDRFWTNRW